MITETRRLQRYRLLVRRGDERLSLEQAFDEGPRIEAQRLHAEVYLQHGYLGNADLTPDGRLGQQEDPYQDHCRYFVVRDRATAKVVAASRVIEHAPSKGHRSFQTLEQPKLDPQHRNYLLSQDPNNCVEVSGLVKQSGVSHFATILLYRAMWRYSLSRGQLVWLMSCDEKLFNRLCMLFGGSIVPIGPLRFYKGHNVVPSMLHLSSSVDVVIRSTQHIDLERGSLKLDMLRFFLEDVDFELLDAEQRSILVSLTRVDTSGPRGASRNAESSP